MSARTLAEPGNLEYDYIMERISRYLARYPVLGSAQLVQLINGTSVDTVDLPSIPPGIPQNLAAADGATTEITLTWDAPAFDGGDAELNYAIEQGASNTGPWSRVAAPNLTATEFTVTGLTMGTAYFFRVYAIATDSEGVGIQGGRTEPVEHTSP